MKQFFTRWALLLTVPVFILIETGFAQSTISGTVQDGDNNETLAGVNIVVQGTVTGTITDLNGNFNLSTSLSPPINLEISYVGYQSQQIEITDSNVSGLQISLTSSTIMGQEVVVSASRVEESILKSPVSIEKMDILAIRETPSSSFYDAIANMKGVDLSAQSLTHKTVNARGFSSNGNTRFVQLIDGIDNQAPGLNFAVGNIVGISDIDLESAELIPGAASALYGPNALNGILLMKSKSPFEYQGLSAMAKGGLVKVDSKSIDVNGNVSQLEGTEPYQEYALRYAKAFNNKFAFKFNGGYLRTQDFVAQDFRDQTDVERNLGSRTNNRVYNGVSVYGDPVVSVGFIADAQIAAGNAPGATPAQQATAASLSAVRSLLPDGAQGAFTPLGFAEGSYVDNTTESLKLNGAVHYRLTEKMEASAAFNWGSGSTVYTANDRFVLDNFSVWNAKLELGGDNFFVRGYLTQEDAGDTYAANTLASLINQQTYFGNYLTTFIGGRTGQATGTALDITASHALAKQTADAAQISPDDPQFIQLADSLRELPIPLGANFRDETSMLHFEGMYNFKNEISGVDLIAGANLRRYNLQSGATLFALDNSGDEIDYNEYGAYVQAAKALANDNLRLQASLRYDKNENFAGQFSPRVSAVTTVANDHHIRLSFQRGFRIPTTQDQFIDLDVVSRRLIGSNPLLVNRYNFETNQVYTKQSVEAARLSGNVADLEPVEFKDFKTEKVSTVEVGYKGLIAERLFFDTYYYYSSYQDFIAEILFVQTTPNGTLPSTGPADPQGIVDGTVETQEYGFDINADGNVTSHGWALGADYSLPRGFRLTGNVSWNKLIDQDDLIAQGFRSSYNTPEWRTNFSFSNREVIDNLGFNITWRWQDAFFWEASFGAGVIPAFSTLDAQVSYKIPSIKSILKLGAQNLLDEKYTTSFGNPTIGAMYYLSITFDEFLN